MSEKKLVPMEAHTNPALADLIADADPVVAGFMARHTALLERVTVLERGLETIAMWAEYGYRDFSSGGVLSCVKKKAKELLDA